MARTILEHTYEKNRRKIAKNIIEINEPPKEVDLVGAYNRSNNTLPGYVTLDWQHRADIRNLKKRIREYAQDPSRQRPYNILMLADPGSGKSHFVKCLSEAMSKSNIGYVSYNMASLSGLDDLIQPIDAARNLKVRDKLPILFLDEFDSKEEHYANLLPLLWDGEIHIGHRDLRLGKVVILLAGSTKKIRDIMGKARSKSKLGKSIENGNKAHKRNTGDEKHKESAKEQDLLSRINGGTFNIPNLDINNKTRDRRVDKVCIAFSLLFTRFGPELQCVPWALLKFITSHKFKYGVRSIAQLIDYLPYKEPTPKKISTKIMKLPLDTQKGVEDSSIIYNLDEQTGAKALVEEWKRLKSINSLVRFKREEEEPGGETGTLVTC